MLTKVIVVVDEDVDGVASAKQHHPRMARSTDHARSCENTSG